MKKLIGLEAFDYLKENELSAMVDFYEYHIARKEAELGRPLNHDEGYELEQLYDGDNELIDGDDGEKIKGIIEKYGNEILTIVLESDDPVKDENLILACLLEGVAKSPDEIIGMSADYFEGQTDIDEITAYATCLKLVEQGVLELREFGDSRQWTEKGKYWFAVKHPIHERFTRIAIDSAELIVPHLMKLLNEEIQYL